MKLLFMLDAINQRRCALLLLFEGTKTSVSVGREPDMMRMSRAVDAWGCGRERGRLALGVVVDYNQ